MCQCNCPSIARPAVLWSVYPSATFFLRECFLDICPRISMKKSVRPSVRSSICPSVCPSRLLRNAALDSFFSRGDVHNTIYSKYFSVCFERLLWYSCLFICLFVHLHIQTFSIKFNSRGDTLRTHRCRLQAFRPLTFLIFASNSRRLSVAVASITNFSRSSLLFFFYFWYSSTPFQNETGIPATSYVTALESSFENKSNALLSNTVR